jgi:hypothetical protein
MAAPGHAPDEDAFVAELLAVDRWLPGSTHRPADDGSPFHLFAGSSRTVCPAKLDERLMLLARSTNRQALNAWLRR